jgi:hypothetical protein
MKPITTNSLFYGDNLPILRKHLSHDTFKKAEHIKKQEGQQGELFG